MGKRKKKSRYVPVCLLTHLKCLCCIVKVLVSSWQELKVLLNSGKKSLQFIYTKLHLHTFLLHPTILAS